MNDRVNNESMPQAARRMAELITPAATDAEQRHQAFTVISRLMERGGTDTATAARYSRLFGSLGTTKGVDEAQALLLQEITPATPPAEREEALVTLAQAELAAQRNRPDEVLEHYRYARDHRLNGEPLTASASRLCELAAVSDSAAAAREACRYISEGDLGTLPVAEATALMVEALRSKRSLEDAMEWVRISVAALRPKQGGTITRGSSHVNLGKIKVPVR